MTQIPTNQSANPNQFGAAMGDDFREQEEEWEREGLLDPAWEKTVNTLNMRKLIL